MTVSRIINLILILTLSAFAFIGFTVSFAEDDYCQAVDAYEFGPFGAAIHIYETWNGRYMQTVVSSILYLLFGELAAKITPTLVITLSVFAFWWSVKPLAKQPLLISLSLTLALVVMGDTWQILYWIPGTVTYFLPIPLFALLLGMLLRWQYVLHWRGFKKPLVF